MPNQPLPNMPGVTDTLDFVKNLWGGMGVPGMTVPTVSVDDLDKKIADLKAVDAWLALNSSMVRGTIQALEVQRGTLAAIKSMGDAFAKAAAGAAEQPGGGQPGPDAAAQFGQASAWWNTLQEQFKQAVDSALSPEAMSEATARTQEAAAKMAAAMPLADMGKAAAESMAKAARATAGQPDAEARPAAARARAAKPKAGK